MKRYDYRFSCFVSFYHISTKSTCIFSLLMMIDRCSKALAPKNEVSERLPGRGRCIDCD